jgi:hypothetical protein
VFKKKPLKDNLKNGYEVQYGMTLKALERQRTALRGAGRQL